MLRTGLALLVALGPALLSAQDADKAATLLAQARTAFEQGQTDEALKLAGEAIAADAKNPRAYVLRARMQELLNRHAEAVADLSTP